MRLSDFKVLTFDCYGTLIDWESGMLAGLEPLTRQLKTPMSTNEILQEYARHESAQQVFTPGMRYSDLIAIVYKRLAEFWDLPAPWEACQAFGASIAQWPAFADSAAALAYLKQHYKLVILSNVDNASFAASNKRLGVSFDAICTAEDIGSYKPSPRNFDYMLDTLGRRGIGKASILHTAQSLFHDHVPANRAGLATCWIDRRHDQGGFGATKEPETMPRLDFTFPSMAALVEAHKAERAG